jgi:hypothetical protein
VLIVALLWVSMPACLVAPPQVKLRAEMGVVRAESPHSAQRVASLLDRLAPQVHALLPDTRRKPVEVWVQRQLAIYSHWDVNSDVPAFTIEGVGRIHLAEAAPRDLSAALGHELVHALLGETWEPLPAVAEEGLADWVQEQLNPELASSLRADHLAKASAAFDGLALGLWMPSRGQARRRANFRSGTLASDTRTSPPSSPRRGW